MEVFLLCLKVFFARILDVSLGSVRTILIVKGKKFSSALIGFIEVTIWFIIVREALNTDVSTPFLVIAYAGGYASGVLLGGVISDMFISGNLTVQVITNDATGKVVQELRDNHFAVSVLPCKGKNEEENKLMLFIEINKKKLNTLKKIIYKNDEKAFIVANETKYVQNGYFK